jgi:hypothetical protein
MAVGALVGATMLVAGPAGAHNAGHHILPDGTCRNVGSFREAPLVGPDRVPLEPGPCPG